MSGYGAGGKPAMQRRRTQQFTVAGPCEHVSLKLFVTATHSTIAAPHFHTLRFPPYGKSPSFQ
jgi:hypothetical protein